MKINRVTGYTNFKNIHFVFRVDLELIKTGMLEMFNALTSIVLNHTKQPLLDIRHFTYQIVGRVFTTPSFNCFYNASTSFRGIKLLKMYNSNLMLIFNTAVNEMELE